MVLLSLIFWSYFNVNVKWANYINLIVLFRVSEDYGTALGAVYAVKVTYTNVKKPLLDMNEAIQQKSFFPKPCKDVVVGDPDGRLKRLYKSIN